LKVSFATPTEAPAQQPFSNPLSLLLKKAPKKPPAISAASEYPAFPRMFNGPVSVDAPALVVSRKVDSVAPALDWFRAQGVKCYHLDHFADALSVALESPRAWSYLIVDIDDFGGVDGIIDEMMQLRLAVPGLPVVLLSSGFAVNDFGSDRLYVADASLRLPLSFRALELAVEDAPRNNKQWCSRVLG